MRPSAHETALLTLHLVGNYDQENERVTTRARISAETLRRISLRAILREAFVSEWIDELGAYGWSVSHVRDHFGLIKTDSIEGWPRIASRRINDTLARVRRDDRTVFDEIAESLGNSSDIEEADE